jgi:hypothetical protein
VRYQPVGGIGYSLEFLNIHIFSYLDGDEALFLRPQTATEVRFYFHEVAISYPSRARSPAPMNASVERRLRRFGGRNGVRTRYSSRRRYLLIR